jgi:hypothetical protein
MNAPRLTVRRLLIDLSTPFGRRWNGGDAFRTAWFNALSMSFPLGEQFFIDSVRAGLKLLPEAERERFEPEVQGFVGQEATHRRIHALFNAQLTQQGHVNAWEARIRRRLERLQGAHPRHAVAITAATEHFTAILAEHLLLRPQVLEGAEPRLRTLWLWHAAEETSRHGLRSVPGARRQRTLAAALVPARQLAFLQRRAAPDRAQPGPRRCAVAYLDVAQRGKLLLRSRRPRAANLRALVGLLVGALSSAAAGRRSGNEVVEGQH